MFGSLGAPEIAIIAVVLILLFGVGKLSGLGKDLGSSVREFRKAVKDPDDDQSHKTTVQTPPPPPQQQYTPPAPPQQPQYTPPPPQQGSDQGKNIF